MVTNKALNGLLGLCVGDALGVPVEFQSRAQLKRSPVTGMIGYGTHNQPPGTWSDDSSLALCLAESLCNGYALHDIADKFCRWLDDAYWTPHGSVFDIGIATREAIIRLKQGIEPTKAGGIDEYSNGNGSLMRILPLAYYLERIDDPSRRFGMIHNISALTHAHPRSQLACGLYIQMASHLLQGISPRLAYTSMKDDIKTYYRYSPYLEELPHFDAILEGDISGCPEEEIQSSGYVIHTLEASLWCLLNYGSYKDTVLAAINLGEDTDTTGAVVGGLAGIYYGTENIPQTWLNQLARKHDIIDLAERLYARCYGPFQP